MTTEAAPAEAAPPRGLRERNQRDQLQRIVAAARELFHLWLGSEAVTHRNVKRHLRRGLELLFDGLRQR